MSNADEPDWVALGLFVQHRREELGMSKKQAALAADVSTKWWSNLEAGRGTRRGEYLGRAALALGVTLAELKAVLTPAD